MTWLCLNTGELGIDRLVRVRTVRLLNLDEEIRDTAYTVMDERHLKYDVVALVERITDSCHPVSERLPRCLVALGDRQHAETERFVVAQAVRFMLESLVGEELSEG